MSNIQSAAAITLTAGMTFRANPALAAGAGEQIQPTSATSSMAHIYVRADAANTQEINIQRTAAPSATLHYKLGPGQQLHIQDVNGLMFVSNPTGVAQGFSVIATERG